MNTINRHRILAVGLLGLMVIGCKPESPATAASSLAGSERISRDDQRFITDAAQIGRLEQAAADIALDRSTRADVKVHAGRLGTDHQQATIRLAELASTRGVGLPTELDDDGRALIDELRSTDRFDDRYIDAMAASHSDAVALYDDAASDAGDVDLRALAAAALPALKQHRDMAAALDDASDAATTIP